MSNTILVFAAFMVMHSINPESARQTVTELGGFAYIPAVMIDLLRLLVWANADKIKEG